MGVFKKGLPWLRRGRWIPRLFLHEKSEKRIRWALRTMTAIGIATSVISLPWQQSLVLAIALVAIEYFIEKTLFYYTSIYVQPLPDFTYDPDKWVANAFVSFGEPSDPSSEKMVGLVFNDSEYADNFFKLLRSWNNGDTEDKEGNICLTFITDEDMYYVYLYPSFDRKSIKRAHEDVERENVVEKYGKEHLGLIMSLIICKGFETRHGYALGTFADNHPQDKPFLLAPFIHKAKSNPEPLFDIEPIELHSYKAKTPGELTEHDFEYVHWRTRVRRRGLGGDA